MLHSIYDLTTYCRKTTGDVPAKLVGASTTVVGDKMYLFGGRLVAERRMVSELYVFNLQTFVWEHITYHPEDDVPRPRYFHSSDTWNNHLVIFGGMSNQPNSINPDELCVLNDVRFFNLATGRWLPASPPLESDPLLPRARYAHLSSVTGDRLFIIGGQDFFNTWLDDVCVYDLVAKKWVQRRDYPRHCGTYRSVAVCSNTTVRSPQEELQTSMASTTLGPPGGRFQPAKSTSVPPGDVTPPESLIHLPYSATPTEDHPSDIYLYSNYNFTDVKRELEVFSPLPDSDFTIQDRSTAMTGTTSPPGLRFPTGAILGTHLIIAGTYLAHSYQSFSIWVLDLVSMNWSRIDPGKAIENGSWFRGCLYPDANKFMIFGNRHGNLVDDYNRRLLSWDHVAVVDLEAFGIYQPPPLKLEVRMQELGLAMLEERVLTDFELICDDGQRIPCSRRMLEERWPWFREQRKQFVRRAQTRLEALPASTMHIALPEAASAPGVVGAAAAEDEGESRVDPRLTPRAFHLSEPYPITLAFLQYFYALALITPLQHTPAVLSQLLILGTNYRLPHLESLVKHAMHRSLSNSTSVGVYEVATLCSARSLQIRALKTVMSYTQKRPSRRSEKENGARAARGEAADSAGEGPLGSSVGGAATASRGSASTSSKYVSRPRGTSDAAHWRSATTGANANGISARERESGSGGGGGGGGSSGYNTRGAAREEEDGGEEFRHEREEQDRDRDQVAAAVSAQESGPGQAPSEPGVSALRESSRHRASMMGPATGLMPPRSFPARTPPTATSAASDPYLSSDGGVRHHDGTFAPERRAPTQIYTSTSLSGSGTNTTVPSATSASDLSDYGAMSQTRTFDSATTTTTTTTTDEDYQSASDSARYSRRASVQPGSSSQRSRGWSGAQSNGRYMQVTTSESSIGTQPLGADAFADAAKSPTSAFSRFLSRPIKKQQSLPFGEVVDDSGDALIRNQLVASDDERKRLKKEAKLRALLGQSPGSVGVLGGTMAM